jgi:release factor glutamine methyltransferase
MTIQEATYFILNKLRTIYPEGEASQATDWILEHVTGSKKAERMIYKHTHITKKEEEQLQGIATRLLQHEPVQYVLGEAWFCGLRFYVDKNVLIPRPETEELVEWIITNCKFPVDQLRILDVGTGSGCIPIALKRRLRKAIVYSCDISESAIAVAEKNATLLGTPVEFLQLDILDASRWPQLPTTDIIVSNPPYIPRKDAASLAPNVSAYEPATALFAPDEDPLIFYRAIAGLGKQKLNTGGSIYSEIHEDAGAGVSALFQKEGYSTEIKKDMQEKERMIRAFLMSPS